MLSGILVVLTLGLLGAGVVVLIFKLGP